MEQDGEPGAGVARKGGKRKPRASKCRQALAQASCTWVHSLMHAPYEKGIKVALPPRSSASSRAQKAARKLRSASMKRPILSRGEAKPSGNGDFTSGKWHYKEGQLWSLLLLSRD